MKRQRKPVPSPWAGHAVACLTAAARCDPEATQAAATALVHEYGAAVLPQVMLAWVDAAITQQGITETGEPAQLVFADVDTGSVASDARDVDPMVAWAGRLINARIADDQPGYEALMGVVYAAQNQGPYVTTLLNVCAQTCRLGPRIAEVLGR